MNQIVNTLISALGISRRDQTANELHSTSLAPMTVLDGAKLALVAGGDGDDQGPRGGWKTGSTSAA